MPGQFGQSRSRFTGYSFTAFRKDILAGIIVGIVAIPLAMGFAIASGVRPEYGIYTTIIAGVCISLFGGSKFQIGGPTGAFVPILLSIVLAYGYGNLLIAGFMAGIVLLIMGIFKLGGLISYIPRPVTIGFTSGIAVTIFSGQIANFLGLTHLKKHDAFLANMGEIARHLARTNPDSVITALTCLAVILLIQKLLPRVPGALIGLAVSTGVASICFRGRVSTIGSTYGALPNRLPTPHLMDFSLGNIEHLIGPALVIAMLGGIESLLSAVVADGMTGNKHDSNRELIGQGIANIVAPLFGGIPATGAIARTATNIKSNAVSPIAGVIHSVIVALILLLLAPFASDIPLASMAPILMIVAWNMSERKEFASVVRTRTADSIVLVITFGFTVLTNLTLAVGVGLGLSVVLFTKRMRDMMQVQKVLPDHAHRREKVTPSMVAETRDCPQISIFTIDGPLFFAAAQTFEQSIMPTLRLHPKVLLLRMSQVPFMDTTGVSCLTNIVKDFRRRGGITLISGINDSCRTTIAKSDLLSMIGERHIFPHTGEAITYALEQLDYNKCLGCKHFAFKECAGLSGFTSA